MVRRSVVAGVGIAVLLAAGTAPAEAETAQGGNLVTESFGFTGHTQIFPVPAGVTEVEVVACGAQGGRAGDFDGAGGGLGGRATSTIAVTEGEVLTVVVGEAGGEDGRGGFNGGGTSRNETATTPGVSYGQTGGGGGGASDVRQGGGGLDRRVVVGGGGGGGGATGDLATRIGVGVGGGEGGGWVGGDGDDQRAGGRGATQTAGGAASETIFFARGHDGTVGFGGDSDLSGAGGGGLYGGGGGGVYLTGGGGLGGFTGGGGGGSGLGGFLEPGVCEGDGSVTVSYQPADTDEVIETFVFTGDAQTFVVPAGVGEVDVVACGAQGADGVLVDWWPQRSPGGLGGQATATLEVTAGETLTVFVGGTGRGLGDLGFGSGPHLGGFNGGGNGWFTPTLFGTGTAIKGGGGGASDVRQGGTGLEHRVVIGGGGGGAALDADWQGLRDVAGGAGGGIEGGDGVAGDPTNPRAGGGGASATAGGEGGWGNPVGGDGALGVGGDALDPGRSSGGGGGGGGGLYGGGAGASNGGLPSGRGGGAGGGGSGLGDAFEPGSCAGDGYVTITYTPDDRQQPLAVPGITVVTEGDTATQLAEVPVRLSRAATSPVTIEWTTLDLTATTPEDYVSAAGTVTIEPGRKKGSASITVNGDQVDELPEALLVSFHTATGAKLGGFWGLGAIIIIDDDHR